MHVALKHVFGLLSTLLHVCMLPELRPIKAFFDSKYVGISTSGHVTKMAVTPLASCLIYARALIEYVCGCVLFLFQDVTVREIRGR